MQQEETSVGLGGGQVMGVADSTATEAELSDTEGVEK